MMSASCRVYTHTLIYIHEGTHVHTHTQSSAELSGQGIVVGCYDTDQEGGYQLTECAKDIDLQTHGKLVHMINV